MTLPPELQKKIESLVTSDDVVLFMKGSRSFPQCGFSASVVQVLNTLIPKYTTVNVLSDPEIRDGIKAFSDWPTIPQLYIKGEFIGGSDIVKSMYTSGELEKKLGSLIAAAPPPAVTVSAAAAEVLKGALADAGPGDVVHLTVGGNWDHGLDVGPREATSVSIDTHGITLQLDRASASRAAGVTIDYVEGPQGAGFKIENPNKPAAVRQINAKDLAAKLASGEIKELFDVRTPKERDQAKIEGARLLDDAALAHLEDLDHATPIAFHCHHGGRSQNAAEHFLSKGFKQVYNLAGGIDAWSKDVDSKVPRY